MSERRYTLTEASEALAKAECQRHGHDWSVLTSRTMADPAGRPRLVRCDRCGESHGILSA